MYSRLILHVQDLKRKNIFSLVGKQKALCFKTVHAHINECQKQAKANLNSGTVHEQSPFYVT